MDRRPQAPSKQELLVNEYLANKNIANSNLCPSNTPSSSSKLLVTTTTSKGLKVLPPIKQGSSSLERLTGAPTAYLQLKRNPTDDLAKVEMFKKRDMRAGNRKKQSTFSVGKSNGQS